MHCYVPNFEELKGANWFGPVRLSVHLPPNHPPPSPSEKKRKKYFCFRFGYFVKKSLTLAPSPLPRKEKVFCVFNFFLDLDSL